MKRKVFSKYVHNRLRYGYEALVDMKLYIVNMDMEPSLNYAYIKFYLVYGNETDLSRSRASFF